MLILKNLKSSICLFILFSFIGFNSIGQVTNRVLHKSIKKEAKKLHKNGWYAIPGDLSIEEQLIIGYENAMDDDLVFFSHSAISMTARSAKMIAQHEIQIQLLDYIEDISNPISEEQVAGSNLNVEKIPIQKSDNNRETSISINVVGKIEAVFFRNDTDGSIECNLVMSYAQEAIERWAIENSRN